MKEAIGYTSLPGALVIETRKSGGIFPSVAAAAAVTSSMLARTYSPDAFFTAP